MHKRDSNATGGGGGGVKLVSFVFVAALSEPCCIIVGTLQCEVSCQKGNLDEPSLDPPLHCYRCLRPQQSCNS